MGTLAPDITASQWLNTKPLDLVQLRGKVVLVDFWAIWCAPCVASLPEVARLSKANADLFVVTVHYTASADRVRQYLRQHDIRFPVAIDDGETWKRFSVRHLPTYVLIDRDGRVQWAGQKPPVQADVDRLMPRR
jgi:thiol-disulfide isomerase/thioredoxin